MPEDSQNIEKFIWKGQTRYRCPGFWESGAKCEYDCSDMAQLIGHMRSPHLRTPPLSTSPMPATSVPAAVIETEKDAPEFKEAKFAETAEPCSDNPPE
jgi:hypothetical protein